VMSASWFNTVEQEKEITDHGRKLFVDIN